MPARYALQNHPAFSDPLTKEDLYTLVARGSLARGEMVKSDETGAMHTVGEVINGMRPPRESAVTRPAFREITPDFEGPPVEIEEEADEEEIEEDGYQYTSTGEPILHRSHPSWLAYSKTLFLSVLLAIAAGLLFRFEPAYSAIALVLAVMVLFGVFVSRITHEYIVTPQRVELLWGVVGIKGMLGLGTIDFSTAANTGIEVQFRDLHGAHEVKELVRRLQSGFDPTED
jgi:hypothetical protein